MNLYRILLLLLVITLYGCASNSPVDRKQYADSLASNHHWQAQALTSGQFVLAAYVPAIVEPADHLTIYFEGDGQAWLSPSQPSFDPTPRNPVGLELAVRHPNNAVAYLARPCQYLRDIDASCMQAYWTSRRFAPEVIEASNLAVDELKTRFRARKLTLVGYSGGGAVAALVAARRHDVVQLMTLAGNLDHVAWTTEHRIEPLSGSLNPADEWRNLARIRQILYVGEKDTNIDLGVTESYTSRFFATRRPEIIVMPGFDHHCCWVEHWPDLITPYLSSSAR